MQVGSTSDSRLQSKIQAVLETLNARLDKFEEALEAWAAKLDELITKGDTFQHVCNLGVWELAYHPHTCGGKRRLD